METLYDAPFFGEGWQTAALRLLAAFVAGALLGLERERRERPAGLRTHVLVTLTACLSMLLALGVGGDAASPARVAAGVLTGIGFLGAGTIMRHGSAVRGLTTAAGLWVAAAIGLALGAGWYLGAALVLALAIGALALLRVAERPWRRGAQLLHLELTLAPGVYFPLGLAELLAEHGVEVQNLDAQTGEPTVLHLTVEPSAHLTPGAVLAMVRAAPGVAAAQPTTRRRPAH